MISWSRSSFILLFVVDLVWFCLQTLDVSCKQSFKHLECMLTIQAPALIPKSSTNSFENKNKKHKSVQKISKPSKHMGVSKNNGTPKSSHLFIGFSIIITIHFGGKIPLFLVQHPHIKSSFNPWIQVYLLMSCKNPQSWHHQLGRSQGAEGAWHHHPPSTGYLRDNPLEIHQVNRDF